MGIDITTIAMSKSYTDKATNEIITEKQKENINTLITDGNGNKALFDDGLYKTVSGSASDYEALYNKPSINGKELNGNTTVEQLGFSVIATSGKYEDLDGKPNIPTLISQLTNDSNFISNSTTNLINYYNKSESYAKAEVNTLIANLNSMTIEVVESLPAENISTTTMYLLKEIDKNSYFQWLYINNEWANIGTTEIDLSNYYSKSESDVLLNDKIDKLTGYGLSQENYTSAEKTKLQGLNNYTLPEATISVLGGVKIDDITIKKNAEGGISAVGGSNIIDNDTISATKTWSSDKISSEITTVGDIANDINIAQKTVNTRGTKELLNSRSEMVLKPATTGGTPVLTTIAKSIDLKDNIEKYNFLNFQLDIKTDTRYFMSDITTINISEIKYNNTDVYSSFDGSALFMYFSVLRADSGNWGSGQIGVRFWFKTPTQIYIDMATTPYTEQEYKIIGLVSVKGVNVENVTIDPVNYVNTTQGIEDAPIGNVISVMGKTAPNHYLVCDNTIYNIVDYPHLSQYIKEQFGVFNFFGGDGTTSFAVPDLRGEFLNCIKYEPTYFMSIEGMIEENTLWEGNVGSSSTTNVNSSITLNDSIINYDKIGIEFNSLSGANRYYQYKEMMAKELKFLIDTKPTNAYIPFILGYTNAPDYTNINVSLSSYTTLALGQLSSYVTKVIGIKYKTFQN